jgi:alpha-ribazole phosphatase
MRWIWIRHGETDPNAEGRFLGHHDVPLNNKGIIQAQQTAARLRTLLLHEKGDGSSAHSIVLYTSDLRRAKETATIIWKALVFESREHLPIQEPICCKELRELDFGDWDGLSYTELMQWDAQRLTEWYRDPFACSPPNGETLSQMGNRFNAWFLERLRKEAPEQTVVVVSHGGPLRWFFSYWVEKDPMRFWEVDSIPHGGYVVMDWDGVNWKNQKDGGH